MDSGLLENFLHNLHINLKSNSCHKNLDFPKVTTKLVNEASCPISLVAMKAIKKSDFIVFNKKPSIMNQLARPLMQLKNYISDRKVKYNKKKISSQKIFCRLPKSLLLKRLSKLPTSNTSISFLKGWSTRNKAYFSGYCAGSPYLNLQNIAVLKSIHISCTRRCNDLPLDIKNIGKIVPINKGYSGLKYALVLRDEESYSVLAIPPSKQKALTLLLHIRNYQKQCYSNYLSKPIKSGLLSRPEKYKYWKVIILEGNVFNR